MESKHNTRLKVQKGFSERPETKPEEPKTFQTGIQHKITETHSGSTGFKNGQTGFQKCETRATLTAGFLTLRQQRPFSAAPELKPVMPQLKLFEA